MLEIHFKFSKRVKPDIDLKEKTLQIFKNSSKSMTIDKVCMGFIWRLDWLV